MGFPQRIEAYGYLRKECMAKWDLLTHTIQLKENFRSENDLHVVSTQNFHECDKIANDGVTSIIESDTIAGRVLKSGTGRAGMGR